MKIKLRPGESILIKSEGGKIEQTLKIFVGPDGVIGFKRKNE